MRELKIGERIPVEAGGEAVVSRELGRGGQGIVYLVRYNGREYALKWYFISRIKNPEAFRDNLRKILRTVRRTADSSLSGRCFSQSRKRTEPSAI